jgi:peptidoglycan-N-acetylmuramic acid deacetylase
MKTQRPAYYLILYIILIPCLLFLPACLPDREKAEPADSPAVTETEPAETEPAKAKPETENAKSADKSDVKEAEGKSAPDQVRYEEILAAVKGLSTELKGFGAGVTTDKNNRPLSALQYQATYGKYSLIALTDEKGIIYLTIDEGYENGYTPRILDILKEKNVTATFFVTMDYAKQNPQLIKRMINEGHVIGNHSTTHRSMPALSVKECIDEIMTVHNYVLENYGYKMTLFRPPMGEFSPTSLTVAKMLNYRNIFWSFAYVDWQTDKQPEANTAYKQITSKTHDGAIYLLHAVSSTNTAVLSDVLDYWHAKGYTVRAYR